jgi:hypothetical protein
MGACLKRLIGIVDATGKRRRATGNIGEDWS